MWWRFQKSLAVLLCAALLLSATGCAKRKQSCICAWGADINKFEETDSLHPPPDNAVLFVGSSSIRLWTSLADDLPGIPTINRGFGGSELSDSTYFADRIIFPYHPSIVALYAGENDLAAGKTATDIATEFERFVTRIRQQLPQTPILFISIKVGPARIAELAEAARANELVAAYISRHANLSYVDVLTPMLNAAGQPRAELFGRDGVHLNRAGYSVWTQVIAPRITELRAHSPVQASR